jgi:hypothetical protein
MHAAILSALSRRPDKAAGSEWGASEEAGGASALGPGPVRTVGETPSLPVGKLGEMPTRNTAPGSV